MMLQTTTASVAGKRLLPSRAAAACARPCGLSRARRVVKIAAYQGKDDDPIKSAGDRAKEIAKNAQESASRAPQTVENVVKEVERRTPEYASEAFRVGGGPLSFLVPAFTRRREAFAGRAAMVGLAATLVWEMVLPNHPGPLQQASLLTGWSLPTIELVLGLVLVHGLAGILWGGSPTYSSANRTDLARRPSGPPQESTNPFAHSAKFLGASPYIGFSKANEVLNGRLAMIGFFASCVGEIRSGGLGVIGQLAWWFNNQPTDVLYDNAKVALLGWSAILLLISTFNGALAPISDESEVY